MAIVSPFGYYLNREYTYIIDVVPISILSYPDPRRTYPPVDTYDGRLLSVSMPGSRD